MDYNLSAPNLTYTSWLVGGGSTGSVQIDDIPLSSDPLATDGVGLVVALQPGQRVLLMTPDIDVDEGGTITMQTYFATENPTSSRALPKIDIGLFADSSNASMNTIIADEILGGANYQMLETTYDCPSEYLQGIIQVSGTHSFGTAYVYIDNVRIFRNERKTDRALGDTKVSTSPFDGTFESVVLGLGDLAAVDTTVTNGGRAYLTSEHNHDLYANGAGQSMILNLDDPLGSVRVNVGPLNLPNITLPETITAECYIKAAEAGEGYFAIGLTNGLHTAVTFISNDNLPKGDNWVRISVTGRFMTEGFIDPILIMQNASLPGAVPGLVKDAAVIAVDDIKIRVVQDPVWFWDRDLMRYE